MSGAQTKEVGGGASTGLSDQVIGFLSQGLSSGGFGGYDPSKNPNTQKDQAYAQIQKLKGKGPSSMYDDAMKQFNDVYGPQTVPNGLGQPGSGPQQLQDKTQNGFGSFIDQLMGGGGLSNPDYGVDTSGLTTAGQPSITMDRSTFGSFDPNQGMVDFSSFNPNITNRTSALDLSKFNLDPNTLNIIRSGNTGALPGSPDVSINAGTAKGVDPSSPHWQAVMEQITRQQGLDKANLSERFTQGGGGSMGTPTGYALSELMARQPGEMARAMGELDLAYRNQDLGERTLATNARTSEATLGKGVFDTLVDAITRGDTTYVNALTQNLGDHISGTVAGRGQDINALISEGGLNLDALLGASTQGTARAGLGLEDEVNRRNITSNENIAGADVALKDKGMNLDAIAKALGLDLEGQNLNLNSKIAGANTSGNMIQQILSMLQGMSMPGIAPRQTVMQPSGFQNFVNGVSGLVQAGSNFFKPGLSGGAGKAPAELPYTG